MPITPLEPDAVVGGIDTHQDLHWAAVVDHTGHVLGTEAFSTTRSGYRAMLVWLRSKGDVCRVGVESTGSYGAGITRHLGYPFNRSIPTPISTGGWPVAAPSSAGAHARVAVSAGLSGAGGW